MSFPVVVKADPKTFAKGPYQLEIQSDSVVLTQKDRRIEIPVGANASHLDKNRFEVSLSEARLEITVAKFNIFQNRLSRDLAAFLSGEREAPVPDEYQMPWYFYAVSVLPIGIPIITLGGALPAVVGLGISGACFSVCQNEDLSVPVRLMIAGLLVVIAYSCLFTVLAGVLGGR
jgi:hypothetical protein